MFKLEPVLSDLHRQSMTGIQLGCLTSCLDCNAPLIPFGFHLVCQNNELHPSIPLRLHLMEIARIDHLHQLVSQTKQNRAFRFQRGCDICKLDLIPVGEFMTCPLEHRGIPIHDYLEEYRIFYNRTMELHAQVDFIQKNLKFEIPCKACRLFLKPSGESMCCHPCETTPMSIAEFISQFERRQCDLEQFKRRYAQMAADGFTNLSCRICKTPLQLDRRADSMVALICPSKIKHQIPLTLEQLEDAYQSFQNERARVHAALHGPNDANGFKLICDSCTWSEAMVPVKDGLKCQACDKHVKFRAFLNLYDAHCLLQMWRAGATTTNS